MLETFADSLFVFGKIVLVEKTAGACPATLVEIFAEWFVDFQDALDFVWASNLFKKLDLSIACFCIEKWKGTPMTTGAPIQAT